MTENFPNLMKNNLIKSNNPKSSAMKDKDNGTILIAGKPEWLCMCKETAMRLMVTSHKKTVETKSTGMIISMC